MIDPFKYQIYSCTYYYTLGGEEFCLGIPKAKKCEIIMVVTIASCLEDHPI